MKTFKIHMTNKFGLGLTERKAVDLIDCIKRMNKTESKTWVEIWEEDNPDNAMFREEWNELVLGN
jgi:hypothetical protein